jgi:PTH1 family peptidyl-tRNA hydrolase
MTSGPVHHQQVVLVKPQTYMNRSGSALLPLPPPDRFDPARDLLILVDEAALPLGTFRLRATGSAGGHNGLKSIEAALRSRDYARLRIGVGPPPQGLDDLADYVLGEFDRDERDVIESLMPAMADAVDSWLTDGIEVAMQRHNRRPAPPPSPSA